MLLPTNQEMETSGTQMAQIGTPAVEPESTSSTEQTGPSYNVVLVHPSDIEEVWPNVVTHIEKCAPHSEGELDVIDFFTLLSDGDMQLWLLLNDDAVVCTCITQIIPYPRKRVLRIIAMGGEPFKWKNNWRFALAAIEDFALNQGCSSIEAWTRRAFLKIMKDWKSSYSVITKDLKQRMH